MTLIPFPLCALIAKEKSRSVDIIYLRGWFIASLFYLLPRRCDLCFVNKGHFSFQDTLPLLLCLGR